MSERCRASLSRGEVVLSLLSLIECSKRKEQLRSELKTTTFQKTNTHSSIQAAAAAAAGKKAVKLSRAAPPPVLYVIGLPLLQNLAIAENIDLPLSSSGAIQPLPI